MKIPKYQDTKIPKATKRYEKFNQINIKRYIKAWELIPK